jgi:hypothetical protein
MGQVGSYIILQTQTPKNRGGAVQGNRQLRGYVEPFLAGCQAGLIELSASENSRHHARAASSVHHRDNPQRFSVGHVGNHIFVHRGKAQRARSQVRAFVALVRERDKGVDAGQNIRNQLVGGVEIIVGDKIPNLIKVPRRLQVEVVAAHEPYCDRRVALFSRKRAMTWSPGMGFTLPLSKSS